MSIFTVLPAGPSKTSSGLMDVTETSPREQDLEGDELVPRRVECDGATGGVPKVIGGQITLRLGGDQFARDRVDLVQFVENGDLATGDRRQRRRWTAPFGVRTALGQGRREGAWRP